MEINEMAGPNQNKPGGKKHGKRSRKPDQLRKPEPAPLPAEKPGQLRSQKPEQLLTQTAEPQQSAPPEQLPSQTPEPAPSATLEQTLSATLEPAQSPMPEPTLSETPEPLPCALPEHTLSQTPGPLHCALPEQTPSETPDNATVAPANIASIDFQTIASAYGDYTKKSFAQTKAYVEKLSGVRSLDKVVEIQTEFARQAYETFVTESKRIRELYSGLAKQSLRPFEGFTAKKKRGTH